MATLTRGQTFSANDSVTSTKLHNMVDLATIADIVNADISASAAIADTKLAQITTAGKVSGTAISALASLPTSAGYMPLANLAVMSAASMVNGSALFGLSNIPSGAGAVPSLNVGGVSFHVNRTATQSINNSSATKMQMNNEIIDSGSYYDAATNYRFTPLVAGKYFFYAQVSSAETDTTEQNWIIDIRKNGSTTFRRSVTFKGLDANDGISVNASGIIDMNGSTDYVELYISQTNTATAAKNTQDAGDLVFFGGFKVSP